MAGIPEGFGYDDFAANNPPAGIDPVSWRASIYSKRDDSDSRENNLGFFEKLYRDSLRGVHKQGESKYLNYDEIESGITLEKHQAKGGFVGKEIAGAGALLNIATSEAGKAYAKTFPRIKAITDIGLRGVGEVISFACEGLQNFAIASSYDEALQMSGGKLKASDWDYRVTDSLQKSQETILENTTDGQRTMAGIAFGAAGTFVGKKIKLHNTSVRDKRIF